MKHLKLFEEIGQLPLVLTKDQIDELFFGRFEIRSIKYVNNGFPLYDLEIKSSEQLKEALLNTTDFMNAFIGVKLFPLEPEKEKKHSNSNIIAANPDYKTEGIYITFRLDSKNLYAGGNLHSLVLHSLGEEYFRKNYQFTWDDFASVMKCDINWDPRDVDLEQREKPSKIKKFGHFLKNYTFGKYKGKNKRTFGLDI